MFDTLTHLPEFADFIRSRGEAFGIDVQYATLGGTTPEDSVDLPAYAGSMNLRYGRATPTATPASSAAP